MTRIDELKARIRSVMVYLPNRAALDQLCTLYDAETARLTREVAVRDAHIASQAQEIVRLQGLLSKLQLADKPNREQRRSGGGGVGSGGGGHRSGTPTT